MENKEKQLLVSTLSNILILGSYTFYVYNHFVANNLTILNDLQFWGKAFLILIPVSIVAQIIIHILFAILTKVVTNEDLDTRRDERDKLIELKGIQVSHWTFILGFLLSMGSLALGMEIWVMFLTLILSGFFASILSDLTKFYFYRKGF
ncbi:MAG: hypothetical protein QE487_11990 [Fluviicola sp.]|nr:hypothetical protein [Fluviicola sp.]